MSHHSTIRPLSGAATKLVGAGHDTLTVTVPTSVSVPLKSASGVW